MPVLEQGIVCPKCGVKADIKAMRRRKSYECPYCQEPMEALRKQDRWKDAPPKPLETTT